MPNQWTTVSFFDRFAHLYGHSRVIAAPLSALHTATLQLAEAELVDPPSRILDVGCGPAQLLIRAGNAFPNAELVGVDPAAGMLREAAANLSARPELSGRYSLLNGLAQSLALPDSGFQLVLSTLTLHHWEDQASGLRELRRVVSTDGLVVLVVPAAVWWTALPLRMIGWRARIGTAPETAALLASADLQLVRRRKLRWAGDALHVLACRPTR